MNSKQKKKDELPNFIGSYEIIRRLGKGGMGEVLLATDTTCKRHVAIKRVRADLLAHKIIRKRFLKEAKITASLCHPSIMPIYSIHSSTNELYYVMPYIEGETLKQILKTTVENEKNNKPPHPIGISINKLIQIFLNVCHAISYCHSKSILHRDLKPENIIVGRFGQVLIADWGLAGFINEKMDFLHNISNIKIIDPNLTMPGKVLGTLSYMPPERVSGKPADVHTDIYSLGVILYQLLTLRMPFHRRSIQEYKRTYKYEQILDALEAAPYRDVPPQLSEITKKCLEFDSLKRYQSVDWLISDVDKYKSGIPEWILSKQLNIEDSEDWEMQENVVLNKLITVANPTGTMRWFMMMISKMSFAGNKKIAIRTRLDDSSNGIGFLFNVPGKFERNSLEDGYCVWIGSRKNPGIKLCRSQVTISDISDKYITANVEHLIQIEKFNHSVSLFIDDALILHYTDSLPIVGTHVGIICLDTEFAIDSYKIYVGSQSASVDCLSIPDAFLSSKNFKQALIEYNRIANSFPGRTLGREATFKAGITILEQAKEEKDESRQLSLVQESFSKFELLHKTPSEPFEHLGKSLAYYQINQLEEEFKCLELGIRKFKGHSIVNVLEERVIFRLHESVKKDRFSLYNLALMTITHLQHRLENRDTHALIRNLFTDLKNMYFFELENKPSNLCEIYKHMEIQIAFLLDRPTFLKTMLLTEDNLEIANHIKYALKMLGHADDTSEQNYKINHTEIFINLEQKLTTQSAKDFLSNLESINRAELPKLHKIQYDMWMIWGNLLANNFDTSRARLNSLCDDTDLTKKSSSPFLMLRGCQIAHDHGHEKARAFLNECVDCATPYTLSLLSRFVKDNLPTTLFFWEKISLYRQLILFHHCLGDSAKTQDYEKKLDELTAERKVSY